MGRGSHIKLMTPWAQPKGLPTARCHTDTLYLLLTALGLYLSVPKCQLDPRLRALYLGMVLCTSPDCTEVLLYKLQYFAAQLTQLQAKGTASPRDLASMAGMLMSFKPGMPIAPLYTRGLYSSLAGQTQGREVWGQQLPLSDLSLADMAWWVENLLSVNRSMWWRSIITLCVPGDASDIGHAAYTLPGSKPWQMQLSFTEEEQARMHRAIQGQDVSSSSHREVANIRLALDALMKQLPAAMSQTGLQWFTDSQVAVALLRSLKGSNDCLQQANFKWILSLRPQVSLGCLRPP